MPQDWADLRRLHHSNQSTTNANNLVDLLLIGRMPDETDAKKILTAFSLENWRRPSGRPRTMWMKTIVYLKSNNLSLNEATYVAQNHPL